MTLTRREFIGAVLFTPVLLLTGCDSSGIGSLSYDEIKSDYSNYKLVIYNIDNSDIVGKLRDFDYDVISVLENKRTMLVYNYCTLRGYNICMWRADGNRIYLTDKFNSMEEAWEQFRMQFSIIEEKDAFSLFIDEYGVKNNYSSDEIESLINNYGKNFESKTYQKTMK